MAISRPMSTRAQGGTMQNTAMFLDKIRGGQVCFGTVMTSTDPLLTEALCSVLDLIWVDAEHAAFSVETLQLHAMAAKGTGVALIVRVGWNDPVLIKPILDLGADGIIVPLIRTAEDASRAVAACLYPPAGMRGFGPKRANNYGGYGGGPEFCKLADESVMKIVQIEHVDAVENLDEILAVPGLTSIMIGSNDLAGSMGLIGQPRHPDVLRAISQVIEKTRKTDVFVGMALGDDPDPIKGWIDMGVQWFALGCEYTLLLRGACDVTGVLRRYAQSRRS
ncbi:MAG: hypothetical protein A2Z18_01455 [Armatimonadetes bacterium RBG_16_58_9]|nr:MAG: hypothetical protein A2Z18_01455 [Armatimonadetes bacterium RBG_16_58_9]